MKLVAHHAPASAAGRVVCVVFQQLADGRGAFLLGFEFVFNQVDFEFGQAVQLEFKDRFGLFGVQLLETLHDLGGGVGFAVAGADDLDDLIQGVENQREAFEDMDPFFQPRELVLQAAGDDFHAETQEVPEDFTQPQLGRGGHLRVLGGDQAREIHAEVGL